MFFVVRKNRIILALLLSLTIFAAIYFSFSLRDENVILCRKYIKSLGYFTSGTPYEITEIKIPEGFGDVYNNYNSIQKEAGFDLTYLRGKTVTRYTFILEGSEFLTANLLISDGKICGGDILNPSISGKISPLIPKEKE